MPRRTWSLRTAALLIALAVATGTAVAAPSPGLTQMAKAPSIFLEVLRWVTDWIAPGRESASRSEKEAPSTGQGTPASADMVSGCGMDPDGQCK